MGSQAGTPGAFTQVAVAEGERDQTHAHARSHAPCYRCCMQVLLLHLAGGKERLIGQNEPVAVLRGTNVERVYMLAKQVFEIGGACKSIRRPCITARAPFGHTPMHRHGTHA